MTENALTPRDKNKTEQVVGTDPKFWNILNDHFGFSYDLACTRANQLCPFGITEQENSLSVDWHKLEGWLFLNPPFKDIKPWAQKCYQESQLGARIVMLTPASVGTNWFRDFVFQKASVIFLNGRLTFRGHKAPYPKDMFLTVWEPRVYTGFKLWNWKKGW